MKHIVLKKQNISEIGLSVIDMLIKASFANSKTEARNLIKQQAIKVHDVKVSDPFARILLDETGNFILIENEQ